MDVTGADARFPMTSSHNQDAGSGTGWRIHDSHEFESTADSWHTSGTGRIFLVDIKGALVGVAVTDTALTSSADANGNYVTGDVIEVTVTFSGPVTVDTTGGTPSVPLSIGSDTRAAEYSAADSTATALVFAYTVVADDNDADGVSIVADALQLNGGAIHQEGDSSIDAILDDGGVPAHSAHTVNQSVVIVSGGVSVLSIPRAASDAYGVREIIEIGVEFSRPVDATADTDFVVSVGGAKRAPLVRGSGTNTLVFGYTVQSGDSDDDGIWIGDQDRTLVGDRRGNLQNGEITTVSGVAVDLAHGEVGRLSGHKVDGTLVLPVVTIAADHAAFTAQLDRVSFTLTRTDDPSVSLDVAVVLTQDGHLIGSEYLAHTVTFGAGEATAKLRVNGALFASGTVTGEATLTATVHTGSGYVPGSPASASTRIRVADPAVTVWIEETAYTFDEGVGTDATVAVVLRTATGVPVPHELINVSFSLKSRPGQTAESPLDYTPLSVLILAEPTDFTADGAEFIARKEVTLTIVDDALDEPDETLTVVLERSPGMPEAVKLTQPDGTVCPLGCEVPVTITDNDEPSEVTIAADHEAFTAEIDDVTFTLPARRIPPRR